jgi:diguanylate cyclase (GGDEF)-like protein
MSAAVSGGWTARGRQPTPSRHDHALRYAALGALLAAGAPIGLFAVRVFTGAAEAWRPSEDWATDRVAYTYVYLSTTLVFSAFGALLGRKADSLVRLAAEDPLTGLLNRRAMEERLEQELQRTARYGEPLSVLLMDVDGLKQINDAQGHAGGDRALRAVAKAMREQSRAIDLAGRWGGDEFLIAAPNTDAAPATHLAERIRRAVVEGADGPAPTISVGVATCREQGRAVAASRLLALADDALYRAKQLGRNRVAVGPLPPPA